jgi:hypothetical protein
MSKDEIIQKYSADELIIEAETLEECGEYLHFSLIGYSAKTLREMAELAKNKEKG